MTVTVVRPLVVVIGYFALTVAFILQMAGVAVDLPSWFNEMYIGGTAIYVLGWSGFREQWKRSRGG